MSTIDTTEANFLAAIAAAPTDESLRLIYADWLEEAGRPEAATLYRLEAEGLRRKASWLAAAEQGDASALLSHPESRKAIATLARGEKPSRRAKRVTDYTSHRAAIAAAKAVMVAREERRAARKVAEAARTSPTGQVRAKHLTKLHVRAVELGRAYHRAARKLYQSAYGDVLYGRGGQATTDRDRYSKGWHNSFGAASNLNGGARLDSEDHPTCVILENHRGTEVARLPLSGE